MANFRRLVFDNFLIKVISFVAAVGLWFYVSSRGDSEINLMVPLELRNVPPSMTVIGGIPDFVNVKLKGRHDAIRGLDPSQVNVELDLTGADRGENYYTLTMANVHVPPTVEVTNLTPNTLALRLEPVVNGG
jgi:YbbR domain-containing protein